MAYKITEKCAGCGNCMSECPQGAISSGTPYVIDQDNCVDCGGCAVDCPSDAIIRTDS